ncbi:hypothetical protein C5167_041836 [Papaver somniferum]|nr:hypothetical protein C5167_041836 [Papaver somniferum]
MCDLDSLDQVRFYIPSLLQSLSSISVSPSSSSASPSSYASLQSQRPMDMNSSNPDGIVAGKVCTIGDVAGKVCTIGDSPSYLCDFY